MKSLFLRIGIVASFMALAFCLFGCSSQPSDEQSQQDGAAEESQRDQSVSLVGAFHTLTGMSEPTEFVGTAEEIEQVRTDLKTEEANDDEKTIFVAMRVAADDRENKNLGVINGNAGGALVSAGELSIDGINTYSDIYGLNSRDYFDTLEQLGYHDGAKPGELLGGSGETYSAIFLFKISNNDFENGQTAHLQWGDYNVDFNMSDIQEVDNPLAMVDVLQNA